MYIVFTEDRPMAWSEDTQLGGGVRIDVPGTVDTERLHDYRLVEGEWVYDPLPEPLPVPTQEDRLAALEAAMLEMILGGAVDG